jgi:hypothetical protein
MNTYDYSEIRRELDYQEFMIPYLQEEQKKRWEYLDEIKKIGNTEK